MDWVLVSEFFYTSFDVFNLSGPYEFHSFAKIAEEWCARDWEEVWTDYQMEKYPNAKVREGRSEIYIRNVILILRILYVICRNLV